MKANCKASYLVKDLIKKQGWMDLPADGTSMYPLIKKGDICRFISHEASKIKKGDVLLFRTLSGNLVAHRLVRIYTHHNQVMYLLKGDTNLGVDEPITETQIMGELAFIKRGKKKMNVSNPVLHAWGKVVLFFPVLSALLRSFLNKKSLERM
jgi:signal peptidase I